MSWWGSLEVSNLTDDTNMRWAGAIDEEYTITCELPTDKVGLLIGKRGEDVQRIRNLNLTRQQ